jgi:hypothetical protein
MGSASQPFKAQWLLYVPPTLIINFAFCPQSVFMGFLWFLEQTAIISQNSINQLSIVMVKCLVLFQVRTEFLNII